METPSKKRKPITRATTGPAGNSPATVRPAEKERMEWEMVRAVSELGSLAATTCRHARFGSRELYGPLLSGEGSADDGWWTVPGQPRKQGPARVIAMDAEMAETRDGQVAVSAAAVAYEWPFDVGAGRVVFEGLLRPAVDDWAEIIDWKTDIHGISAETLLEAENEGTLRSLADFQSAIQVEWTALAFLAGHRLCGDLKVLHIQGPALRRRVIDTSLIHWSRGPPSLRALFAETKAKSKTSVSAGLGETAPDHDAKADAVKTAAVVIDDIYDLCHDLDAPLVRSVPEPIFSADVLVPEACLGRLIGKKGATLADIKSRCPQVTLDLDSSSHPPGTASLSSSQPENTKPHYSRPSSSSSSLSSSVLLQPPPQDEQIQTNNHHLNKKARRALQPHPNHGAPAASCPPKRLRLRSRAPEHIAACLDTISAIVPALAPACAAASSARVDAKP